jgi:hypothetical protein
MTTPRLRRTGPVRRGLLAAAAGAALSALAVTAGAQPAPAAGAAQGAPVRATPARRAAVPVREVTINRETFTYQGNGRRDPYGSLMTSTDVRPLLSDLRLTGVAFDPAGRNSVAIMRDLHSKAQYRVSVGQQLGRLRVAAIHQRSVQFAVDEFGFSRTESLQLSRDTSAVRNP